MAYTPTNWKDGDIISAEKMNKLEHGVAEGGGGGVLLVNVTNSSDDSGGGTVLPALPTRNVKKYKADKTYFEVDAAVKAGKMVYLVYGGVYIPLSKVSEKSDTSGPM